MTLYIDTKPTLEWDEDKAPDFYSADTMFGSYCIYHYDRKDDIDVYILRLYDPNCEFGDDLMNDDEPLRPLVEAKAAAQADYERRTAERFRPITLPERMNARHGDGSVHYCTGWNDVLDAIDRAKEAK